jgi:hypothetical protein
MLINELILLTINSIIVFSVNNNIYFYEIKVLCIPFYIFSAFCEYYQSFFYVIVYCLLYLIITRTGRKSMYCNIIKVITKS